MNVNVNLVTGEGRAELQAEALVLQEQCEESWSTMTPEQHEALTGIVKGAVMTLADATAIWLPYAALPIDGATVQVSFTVALSVPPLTEWA